MIRILLIVFIFSFINCDTKNSKCSNEASILNYKGYGIIKFQKSYYGSVRYIEFYPLCNGSINNNFSNIKYGIIFRVTNTSKLWNSLINDKRIKLDELNYGMARIKINYNYTPINDKVAYQKFINHLMINGKRIKVNVLSTSINEIKINSFQIFNSI